jgi:hypothetical protein
MYTEGITDKARIVAKAKEILGKIEHPQYEDTWREVQIEGEFYDCNIYSRKNVIEEEDENIPDVVAVIYPTYEIEDGYRDTDTNIVIGRFYPEVEEE